MTFVFFLLVTPQILFAAEVYKYSKTKVLIKLKGSKFKKGQILEALDKNGNQSAILKVYKLKKKTVRAKIIKGKVRRGYIVEKLAGSSENVVALTNSYKGLRGNIGLITGTDYDGLPVGGGIDYMHPFGKNYLFRVGALYWLGSTKTTEFKAISLALGASYIYPVTTSLLFEFGLKLGNTSTEAKTISEGKLVKSELSSMVYSPIISVLYKINRDYIFGIELRSFTYSDSSLKTSPLMGSIVLQYNL